MSRRGALLLAPLLLAACAKDDDLRRYAVVRRADVWQAVISDADRGRLSRLSTAWDQARTDISGAGADAQLAALAPLDGPAQAQPQLPGAGGYRCRIVHLGWRQGQPTNVPPVQAGGLASCRLNADGLLLRLDATIDGQRLIGTLYPDVDRLIYLGSVALAGEPGLHRYGDDGDRNQLGVLEQVAPGRWRIALPWPRWTARLTLIEIVPA
jgi:hypothetical protein